MECRPAAFLALLTLLASGEAGGAEPPDPAPPDVKAESLRLIESDSRRLAPAPAGAPTSAAADPSVIKLSPFIVRDKAAAPAVIPHYLSPVQRFLRDGTLYQRGPASIQGAAEPARAGVRFELSLNWKF